jgi:hypothetical protein
MVLAIPIHAIAPKQRPHIHFLRDTVVAIREAMVRVEG